MPIRGLHGMFYTSHADEIRAFFRDKLGFPFKDAGEGWLIFDMPAADLGFHPENAPDGKPNGHAEISFHTDDLETTIEELKAKGVEFTTGIEDHGFGYVTFFRCPGDLRVQLYQPKY